MTIPSVDSTTLNDLAPNLDVGDVADPALRLASFQYIYTKLQEIIAELNSLPTANYQNLSVTPAKIAEGAIIPSKIPSGSLTADKFVPEALTNDTQNGLRITELGAETSQKMSELEFNKASKTEVNDGLESKRDKSMKIVGLDLDISSDINKIKLINLSDEVQLALTGSAPALSTIASNGVTKEKVAPQAINRSKLNFNAVSGIPSINLFDKTSVTRGSYISYSSGTLQTNAIYSASDYIVIEPSVTYINSQSEQIAFYDVNYAYISGLNLGAYTSFTTPSGAAYVRVSVKIADIDSYMLVLGAVMPLYESAEPSIPEVRLVSDIRLKINKPNYMLRIMDHLENPFVRTKIKLLGDSITAGVGGTGYSATGEDIGSTGFKSNVLTATSWANMLYNLLSSKYNKKHYVAPGNPAILNQTSGVSAATIENFNLSYLQWRYRVFNYTAKTTGLKLSFYGTSIDVLFQKRSASGILEVLIDGASHGYIDAYNTTTTYSNIYAITGLSEDYHTIEVVETGTKNASATDTITFIEGFAVNKTVVFKNYGISGKDSEYYYVNRTQLITADDDIVIMQLGTNDRKNNSADVTKQYQREIIRYANSLGSEVILMCSIPATVADENNVARKLKMADINTAIRQLADEFNMGYISNYEWFLEYIKTKGIDISSLLSDGLHPNDEGHAVMFGNIAKRLGMSIVQVGVL